MSLSSHKASGRRTTLVVTALVLLAVGAGLWFWVLKPASHGTAAPAGMPPPPGAGGPGGYGGKARGRRDTGQAVCRLLGTPAVGAV